MARIALGAAVQNIACCAQLCEMATELMVAESVSVRLDHSQPQTIKIPSKLTQRVTNRRLYDARKVDLAELPDLQRTAPTKTARAVWMCDRNSLSALSRLIAECDALMFSMQAVRRAFLENVRFDRPPNEPVDAGLSLGSLELAAGERMGMSMVGTIPDSLYGIMGLRRAFFRKAQSLIESASGVCLVTATGDAPATDIEVGRQMESAWLSLTELGFAAQPMMSLPVLENMALHNHAVISDKVRTRTIELSGQLKRLAEIPGDQRIAAILRFGFAPPPSGRTGRRPLESSVQIAP
jgi:hypothetical protein